MVVFFASFFCKFYTRFSKIIFFPDFSWGWRCKVKMKEFSIMPADSRWSLVRLPGLERHEVYEGRTGNREKSIEDGLVVFLSPELHRGPYGVHGRYGSAFSNELKALARSAWCSYYGKSDDEFLARYRCVFKSGRF